MAFKLKSVVQIAAAAICTKDLSLDAMIPSRLVLVEIGQLSPAVCGNVAETATWVQFRLLDRSGFALDAWANGRLDKTPPPYCYVIT